MPKAEDQRSYSEMLSDFKSLKAQMEKKADARVTEIIEELKILSEVKKQSIAEMLGIDVQEKSKRSYTRGGANTNAGKPEPKYQNPENHSQTWSGRGARPNWIKDCLKSGKTLDDLKITTEGLNEWRKANSTAQSSVNSSKNNDADRAEEGDNAAT